MPAAPRANALDDSRGRDGDQQPSPVCLLPCCDNWGTREGGPRLYIGGGSCKRGSDWATHSAIYKGQALRDTLYVSLS